MGRRPYRNLEALLAEADALGVAGNYEAAARRFEEVVLSAPERPDGHIGLARARADQGRVSEAMRSIGDALEVDPGFLPAYGLAARVGLHFRRAGSALQIVEAGSIAYPDHVEIHLWLARLQATKGQVTPLRRTLRRLSELLGETRSEVVRRVAADDDLDDRARHSLRLTTGDIA